MCRIPERLDRDGDASKIADQARCALGAARQAHGASQDADAIEMLAAWLDGGKALAKEQDPELVTVHQGMVALGCWLCNAVATRHLSKRQVARAFTYTRTCDRWLSLRKGPSDNMWLKLRFDCHFNAAELAQTSDDTPKAIAMLRECEKLQLAMKEPPEPEAVYICLAEVLLKVGQHEEAAGAAQHAASALKVQQLDGNERKRYSLLFALALEQSALGAVMKANGIHGFASERALRCLPDAESIWFAASSDSPSPVDNACRELLVRMRRLHHSLLQTHQKFQVQRQRLTRTPTTALQSGLGAREVISMSSLGSAG